MLQYSYRIIAKVTANTYCGTLLRATAFLSFIRSSWQIKDKLFGMLLQDVPLFSGKFPCSY